MSYNLGPLKDENIALSGHINLVKVLDTNNVDTSVKAHITYPSNIGFFFKLGECNKNHKMNTWKHHHLKVRGRSKVSKVP
jgi:hypothetical protein